MVKSLRLVGILCLVTSCLSLAGSGESQVKRGPQIEDILDEALPVKLLQHFASRKWAERFSARYVDGRGKDVFWFSLRASLQNDRTYVYEGEYAYEAEPVTQQIRTILGENAELDAKAVAERLHFRRFSVSSKTCPEIVPIIQEIGDYSLAASFPLGIPVDTPGFRLAIQTYSSGLFFRDNSSSELNLALKRWILRMRDVLHNSCRGEAQRE